MANIATVTGSHTYHGSIVDAVDIVRWVDLKGRTRVFMPRMVSPIVTILTDSMEQFELFKRAILVAKGDNFIECLGDKDIDFILNEDALLSGSDVVDACYEKLRYVTIRKIIPRLLKVQSYHVNDGLLDYVVKKILAELSEELFYAARYDERIAIRHRHKGFLFVVLTRIHNSVELTEKEIYEYEEAF